MDWQYACSDESWWSTGPQLGNDEVERRSSVRVHSGPRYRKSWLVTAVGQTPPRHHWRLRDLRKWWWWWGLLGCSCTPIPALPLCRTPTMSVVELAPYWPPPWSMGRPYVDDRRRACWLTRQSLVAGSDPASHRPSAGASPCSSCFE